MTTKPEVKAILIAIDALVEIANMKTRYSNPDEVITAMQDIAQGALDDISMVN